MYWFLLIFFWKFEFRGYLFSRLIKLCIFRGYKFPRLRPKTRKLIPPKISTCEDKYPRKLVPLRYIKEVWPEMDILMTILGHFQGQNSNPGPLNPFNGLFGANLVPYSQGHIAKDLAKKSKTIIFGQKLLSVKMANLKVR